MSDGFDWLTPTRLVRLALDASRAARWHERRPILMAIAGGLMQWVAFVAILFGLGALIAILYRGFDRENTLSLTAGFFGVLWICSQHPSVQRHLHLPWRLNVAWRLPNPLKYLPATLPASKFYKRIPVKTRRWALAGMAAIAAVAVLATVPFGDLVARFIEPEKLAGRARVVDGDTLVIKGQVVRLYGIDAPEPTQTCRTAHGSRWRCGQRAIRQLRRLTRRRKIECLIKVKDDQGRPSAVCLAGKRDINRAMVRQGLAWAFRDQSSAYSAVEERAKKARRGLWRGKAQAPWDYRSKSWRVAEARAPDGCPIKGDISRRGKIYHVPWSRRYRRVRVNMRNGERWFCSEREALAAGWRAPRRR